MMIQAEMSKVILSQPLSKVEWVPRDSIKPNDYNPNHQAPAEYRLLKLSILEDGWTQPIVICDAEDGSKPVIIDGEHRWKLAADPEIAAFTDGLVPVVRITGDEAKLRMSTIRHNRARGEHEVLKMADIVHALLAAGRTKDDIMFLLQMEEEEVDRLAERAGTPEVVHKGQSDFNKGWTPQ